jgi:hypothetical protein
MWSPAKVFNLDLINAFISQILRLLKEVHVLKGFDEAQKFR